MRASQEKALQALQDYTLAHYPESPAKFGELLLRIPELQRACNVRLVVSFVFFAIIEVLMVLGKQRDADEQIKGWRGPEFQSSYGTASGGPLDVPY